MGNRRNGIEKRTARLAVKKETLRALQSLSADELRAAAGGWFANSPTRIGCLPSCNGC